MSDLIDRQKAIDAINEECDKFEKMREGIVYAQGLRCAIPILDTMPAVDITRCNECKYYQGVPGARGHAPCSYWGSDGVMWDWYCSQGERTE